MHVLILYCKTKKKLWRLPSMCLLHVAEVGVTKKDNLSFIVFTTAPLSSYQYPVDRKCCPSYFTYDKEKAQSHV